MLVYFFFNLEGIVNVWMSVDQIYSQLGVC